jgi:hypothetical protein
MPICGDVLGLIDATSNDGLVSFGAWQKPGLETALAANRSRVYTLFNLISILRVMQLILQLGKQGSQLCLNGTGCDSFLAAINLLEM